MFDLSTFFLTVAILAQGTSWAVAVTQAFLTLLLNLNLGSFCIAQLHASSSMEQVGKHIPISPSSSSMAAVKHGRL